MFAGARAVLAERFFTDTQINRLLPKLNKNFLESPNFLAEIVDTWNIMMSSSGILEGPSETRVNPNGIPPLATPPRSSPFAKLKINMNMILAEVEPGLLNVKPEMVLNRRSRIDNLLLTNNMHDNWAILFNAPRGFYLQEWQELAKKVFYIDQKVIPYIYDKKQRKNMLTHPLVKAAAITETNFDHIRTRYLFTSRSGFKSLSHMHEVKSHAEQPGLREMILSDDATYLKTFAPYCSSEEYIAFSNLIKNHDIDEDDAELFEELAKVSDLGRTRFSRNKSERSA